MSVRQTDIELRQWILTDFADSLKRRRMFVRQANGFAVDCFRYGDAAIQTVVVGWPLGYSLAAPTAAPFVLSLPGDFAEHLVSKELKKALKHEMGVDRIDLNVVPQGVFPDAHDLYSEFRGRGNPLDFHRHMVYHIAPGDRPLHCFMDWLRCSLDTMFEAFAIPFREDDRFADLDWTALFAESIDTSRSAFLSAYCLSPRGRVDSVVTSGGELDKIGAWLRRHIESGTEESLVPTPEAAWGLARAVPLNMPTWLIVPRVVLPEARVKPIPVASKVVAEKMSLVCSLRARLVRLLTPPWFTATVISPNLIGLLEECLRLAPPAHELPFDPVAELHAYVDESRTRFPSLDPFRWQEMYRLAPNIAV